MADIWVAKPVTKTTINTAIASASPGDVVIIPDGTYHNLSDRNNRQITIAVSGSSGSGNEITLKAETPGGVKFTGTAYIVVDGSYWTTKDCVFENIRSYSPSTIAVVMFNIRGNHVRVTNNHFKNIGVAGDRWGGAIIRNQVGADYGEIDYNTFENWDAVSAICPFKALNLHVHHNYFTNPTSSNHASAMHIGGDSIDYQTLDAYHIIEHNYFNFCNGDAETISSKISSTTYRYNVFDGRDNNGKMGALVLRMGDDCIVEGNYFYEMGRNSLGFAVRIHGEGHKIINNYIEGTLNGAISILVASGIHTTPHTSGHVRAKNIQILNNTIINSVSYGMIIGKWWPTEVYKPENLTFKNNIITQSTGDLVRYFGSTGIFVWENNLHYNQGTAKYWVYGESGTSEPNTGIIHATEQPSIPPVMAPVTKNDVGVSWLREILAEGRIVSLTHPASVENGAMCDINAAIKNIGELSGRFKTQILIDSILLVTSPEFTLAGGATSTDKIDPFKAPSSGESMDITIKCIRSE